MQKKIDNTMKSEIALMQSMYMAFWNKYPELRGLLFRVENERKRGRIRQQEAKSTGIVSGVSDFVFFYGGKAWAIEVKRPGGKQSEKQRRWQKLIESQDISYYIVESVEEFEEVIEEIVKKN